METPVCRLFAEGPPDTRLLLEQGPTMFSIVYKA